ncbi:MAG: restriction endonuclease subunit S [Pseudomonadota bacterium]
MSLRSLKPGWKRVKFGDIVRQCKESVDRDNNPFERYVEGGHMDSDNIHIRRWGEFGADYVGPAFHRIFRKGQVLYGSRRTYLKKVAVADFDGITANTTFVCETKDKNVFMQELLPFLMLTGSFTEHSIRESKGSTNPYINWPDIAKYKFSLPPIDEQKRIAEILWAADEAVEAKSRVVSEFVVSWQKLIDSIVPDPDDSSSRTVVRLDDLCSMQNGRPFPSTAYSEHGFKLLRPGNLAPDGSLSWAEGSTVHLGEKHLQENSGWVVRPGDVVINLTAQSLEDGFMGRVCLAVEGDDSLLNQRLGRFLCNEGVEGEYLYRVLQTSRFRRIVEARCEGSKVRHTYFRHFADLPVVKVTPEEQRGIIQAASSIDVARKAANDSVRDSRALLGRLVNGFIENGEAAHV